MIVKINFDIKKDIYGLIYNSYYIEELFLESLDNENITKIILKKI